ncbi:hypothetical protein DITRI_Ditri13aG0153000 [Diplodiscus trichospermus]
MENFSIIILITFLKFACFTASEQPPYVPTDNITLNCGAPNDSYGLDRFWAADKSSSPNTSFEADGGGSVDASVPYTTARVSGSEFKYAFRVTPGHKFLRLYFNSASYKKFDRSKAFFSVKAGSFTLLRNFSAFLFAESLEFRYFSKEFCLNVEENEALNLIFTPSPSGSNDTYAFINGIEIVSMPPNLYYTPPESLEGVPFIGAQSNGFYISNNTALEKVYRLNVGGQPISPINDTGMFRRWSDDFDYMRTNSYLTVNATVPVMYTKIIPRYTAPLEVYQTARTMGPDRSYNEKHNLTWRLQVDSDFKYMIFINSELAEPVADVIMWTDHSKVPYYKDYVLSISKKGRENTQYITIDLHPSDAFYYDVILNGIEVFKVNNTDGNLAGPNPELLVPPPPPPQSSNSAGGKSKMKRRVLIAAGIGCAVSLLTLLSLLAFMVVRRHKKKQNWGINPEKEKSTKSSFLPDERCYHFSLDEIKAATNNFADELIIGKGGFGNVYKGFLDEGETIVAIKRLNPESQQGVTEFLNEIEMLSQLRHVHLVSLIGYCYENREMILVYDYMRNGTLSDHLYGNSYDPLTWNQRLQICMGAAMGLNYLHREVKHTVIHHPKIDMLTTGVKGTWGYLDPEYARGHALTEKSDVYSFGVVLFEVLCARKAMDKKLPEGQVSLAHWARKCIADGTLYQVIDPYLIGTIAPECFKVFVEIAESCTVELGINRPSMNDVMEKLGFVIELQVAADIEKEKIHNTGGKHSYPDIVFPVARDDDLDHESEVNSLLDSNAYSIGILDSTIDSSTSDLLGN